MTLVHPAPAETLPHLSFANRGELHEGIHIDDNELVAEMARRGLPDANPRQYWVPDAEVGKGEGYDQQYFTIKFESTVALLEQKGIDVDPRDVEDTRAFIDEMFGVYTGKNEPYRRSEKAAFVAATRLQRNPPGGHTVWDYRAETLGPLPILRYLDEQSAQTMLVGMAPFVLDYYGGIDRKDGNVMIFSPLFLDLPEDTGDMFPVIGTNIAKDTSYFARDRMGVYLGGLAAGLPRVTGWGELYRIPGFRTTTGHGGTAHLMIETGHSAIEKGLVDPKLVDTLGVVGVGGMGQVTAELILKKYSDARVAINDFRPPRMREIADRLRETYGSNRVVELSTPADVLAVSGVTYSAVTRAINLDQTHLGPESLLDHVIVDDSEPKAVSVEQVEARGGYHLGVIGTDNSPDGFATSTRWFYGGDGKNGSNGPMLPHHVYGCTAEVVSVEKLGTPDDDIIAEATVQDAVRMGELLEQAGITVGPLQTMRQGIGASLVEKR